MIERFLRAGAAILAGLSIAWDHLHTQPDMDDVDLAPVLHPCPHCGASLTAGPHIHGDAVIWATDHDGAVLVTDHDGGNPVVVAGHAL